MRKRLNYANVMATLAFFFALSGVSMAGVKYIAASDPIPSTSDLTGTYRNPMIASGKVTTGDIADGAVTSAKFDSSATAPNAAKLGGLDVIAVTTGFPFTINASTTAETFVNCPSDRVPIHATISAGPDIHVTEEDWSGLLRHSDLGIQLANTGAQTETFTSVTLDCFGASS
jgi:hypothetical protein